MYLVKEALLAVVAATWIIGLVSQFGSWSMTAFYIAISLVMVALTFGSRLVFKFAPQRNRPR
jgi:hypothetical protein